MGYQYCQRCNSHWVPGCGEEEYHARCPHHCSLCGRAWTDRRDDGSCQGHPVEDVRAAMLLRHGWSYEHDELDEPGDEAGS